MAASEIPAALRQGWQVKPGEKLMARLEDDRLILEKPAHIVARVKAICGAGGPGQPGG